MDSGGFSVTVKRSEVIAAGAAQDQWLALSNLDLLLPPLDYGFFFCYNKDCFNQHNLSSPVDVFKKSLAEALFLFYPLAGEIVHNGDGEPEIHCNNYGVDFTHAVADVELKDIDFYRQDDSVHAKLVPIKMHGLLSVQVTELKCGGCVMGCTFDHRVADTHSAMMFLTAWANIAQSKPIKVLPSFRRSLLNPRRPSQPQKTLDQLYAPLLSMPPAAADRLTSRTYYIKSDVIDRLQSEATSNGSRKTKIESFCAFLWKTLAAAADDGSKTIKLGIVTDGRVRLSSKTTSFERYFGNVLSIPFVEANAGDLETKSTEGVAEMVHECIGMASTAEHFRSLVDWVESRRPEAAAAKVYLSNDENDEAVVVSSAKRFTLLQELDFGWGKPDFGSCNFPWGGQTGFVMPMPSPTGDGDWIVYMHVKEKLLDLLEAHASHVIRPITSHYLKLA